ncbi:MAG: hypothetical protein J6A09_02060, partial [Alphaproteobacteria bacterium]|nr:hypothetical protein [Alphaproteobacteria bacterium]
MFNNGKEKLLVLTILALIAKVNIGFTADAGMAIVDTADLPINVANKVADKKEVTNKDAPAVLVSPTKAQAGSATATAPQMPKEENKALPGHPQPVAPQSAQAQPTGAPAMAS